MEEQRRNGHRVRRNSNVIRRVQTHKKTMKLRCDRVADNCNSKQSLVSGMPYHAVFGFLIPLLIAVLQVNNQGTNKYSFDAHPSNLWAFLLSTLVYCFAIAADIRSQFCSTNCAHLYSGVAVISGSLSSVSLISILLPGLPGRLIFVMWATVSIVVSHSMVIRISCWLYQMITNTFFQALGIWNRFKTSSFVEQPRLPV